MPGTLGGVPDEGACAGPLDVEGIGPIGAGCTGKKAGDVQSVNQVELTLKLIFVTNINLRCPGWFIPWGPGGPPGPEGPGGAEGPVEGLPLGAEVGGAVGLLYSLLVGGADVVGGPEDVGGGAPGAPEGGPTGPGPPGPGGGAPWGAPGRPPWGGPP